MKKGLKFTVFLLTAVCIAACFRPITSYAGRSKVAVGNSSFAEKINNTIWNNPEGDVLSENNKLVFPAESTEDTRLISKSALRQNELTPVMFHAEYAIKAAQLPEGQEFVLACGLSSIESRLGEEGNVELALANNGGITAALRAYEAEGEATILAEPQKTGVSQGSSFKVELTLTSGQEYTVKVNGKEIYNGTLPVNGEGRIGFLQTGGCRVEISDMNIDIYSYDTPENPNIEEHFDGGTFDTSKLTSYMVWSYGYFPCYVKVEPYNDDDVLMFRNSGIAYLGTKYKYSNFELTFDVPYLQRTDVKQEDGTTELPKSEWFGITYGDEYIDTLDYAYSFQSPEMVFFTRGSGVYSLKIFKKQLADLSKTNHAFFDPGENRGFSVRFSLVDAHIEIGIKWMDEGNFTTVASYDLPDGVTPTGYVHIWGSEPSNFAIDNVVLKNLDENPKLIETEYKSGKVIVPEDYSYEPMEMVYRTGLDMAGEEESKEKAVNNWYLMIPCAAAVAVLCVVIPLLVGKMQKRKERRSDEE